MSGSIVILNGTPRAGKSSIAEAMQASFNGVWINLGVDRYKEMIPERYQPGIGLRPGGERPDLEPLIVLLYQAMYESIAIHARMGINVVADVGHHDWYSVPRGILPDAARRLAGLPVLFVGVRCPLDVVLQRRRATWGPEGGPNGTVPEPVARWQEAVHRPGIYDLEVDTSVLAAAESAALIGRRLLDGPPGTAFERLAAG
jgi:chloramphenicol 3-O phosphotransferase